MSLTRYAAASYRQALVENEVSSRNAIKDLGRVFTFEGRPLCQVLCPVFIDGSTYDELTRSGELLVRGLQAVLDRAAFDGAIADQLGLVGRRLDWLRAPAGNGEPVVGRLDGFVTAEGIKFIEYNPVSQNAFPGNLGYVDTLRAAFLHLPVMRSVRADFRIREISVVDALIAALRRLRASVVRPNAALSIGIIAVPPGEVSAARPGADVEVEPITFMPDGELLLSDLMCRGCLVQLCSVDELVYEDGKLRSQGSAIDLAILTGSSTFLDTCSPEHPLLRALRDRTLITLDGYPRGGLLNEKLLFSILSDPDSALTLDEEVADAASKVLPWTRRVRGSRSSFLGERIDLLSFIRSNRERLVLKPSDCGGGEGVILGWECEAAEWRAAVDHALVDGGYVVQERVVPRTIPLPIDHNGSLEFVDHRFDVSPYVWAGGVGAGCAVRVSRTDRLNLNSSGVSWVPPIVLDGRRDGLDVSV